MEAHNNQKPAKARPIPFQNAVLKVDYNCLLGFYCLHLLINKDYQQIKVVQPVGYTPYDCTLPELSQLQALLPCRDPERPSDLVSPYFTLSFKRYKLLRKCLSKELRYLATHGNSRLKEVSVCTLKWSLTAIMEAMLASTKNTSLN